MRIKKIFRTGSVLLFLTLFVNSVHSQELKRERSFDSIRLNYVDINDLLRTIKNYISKVNLVDTTFKKEYFIIRDEQSEFKYDSFSGFEKNTFTTDGNYFFYYFNSPSQTITEVNIDLASYGRKISISGRDHDHVNGLFKILEEKIAKNETFINYSILDIIIIAMIVILPFTMTFIAKILIDRFKINGYIAFVMLIFILIAMMLIIFNGSHWRQMIFPNFIIYTGEKSFTSRNADLFEFIGFVALIGGVIWRSYNFLKNVPLEVTQDDN